MATRFIPFFSRYNQDTFFSDCCLGVYCTSFSVLIITPSLNIVFERSLTGLALGDEGEVHLDSVFGRS